MSKCRSKDFVQTVKTITKATVQKSDANTADCMIVDQGRNPPLSLAATQRGCTKNNNTSRFQLSNPIENQFSEKSRGIGLATENTNANLARENETPEKHSARKT